MGVDVDTIKESIVELTQKLREIFFVTILLAKRNVCSKIAPLV